MGGNGQAGIWGRLRSRIERIRANNPFRNYRMTEPRAGMPEVVEEDFLRLKRRAEEIASRGVQPTLREPAPFDIRNSLGAHRDAFCAYELMNQLDPTDEQGISSYHREIEFMLQESLKWARGEGRPSEHYSEDHPPYPVRYGAPIYYLPDALAQPDGHEKARKHAARVNESLRFEHFLQEGAPCPRRQARQAAAKHGRGSDQGS